MPPEMLRVSSGSAKTTSAVTALFSPTLAGTSATTSKNWEAEETASHKVFLPSHSLQPLGGPITEQDTVVGEPHARQVMTVLATLREGFQQWHMLFQPLHEEISSLGARVAAVISNSLQDQLFSFLTSLQTELVHGWTEIQAPQEYVASSPLVKERLGTIGFSPTAIETISTDAAQRIKGHEKIVREVCSLAREEAQASGLALLRIDVRPAWSHEYEERTGIVIDVEIRASSDERFSYWDAVCERLSLLEDSLPPEEQRFLQDQAFLVVNEG